MIEVEEDELQGLVHESFADILDGIAEEFDTKSLYKGVDVKNWLGSLANQHRKEALKLLNG